MPEAKALFLYSSKTATDTVRRHINEQSDFISVCTVQECPVEIRRNADSGRCGRRRGRKVTMCGAMPEAKALFVFVSQ